MEATVRRVLLALASLAMAAVACGGPSAAAEAVPQRWRLRTQTGMPHLDENLRHAVRDDERCGRDIDRARAFWMLDDVSLSDCTLVADAASAADGEAVDAGDARVERYALRCTGGHGTTGRAVWRIGPARQVGTLDVRLGGKNMTFWQRVEAVAVAGGCR